MKYLIAFILGCALLTAHAQDRGFGLGIIIGEPTGVSVKGWLSDERAIDGALAWSLFGHSWFSAHADYLFHNMRLININRGQASPVLWPRITPSQLDRRPVLGSWPLAFVQRRPGRIGRALSGGPGLPAGQGTGGYFP